MLQYNKRREFRSQEDWKVYMKLVMTGKACSITWTDC